MVNFMLCQLYLGKNVKRYSQENHVKIEFPPNETQIEASQHLPALLLLPCHMPILRTWSVNPVMVWPIILVCLGLSIFALKVLPLRKSLSSGTPGQFVTSGNSPFLIRACKFSLDMSMFCIPNALPFPILPLEGAIGAWWAAGLVQ